MKVQTVDNVWEAISPTTEEAEKRKVRSPLAIALNGLIAKCGLNTTEA